MGLGMVYSGGFSFLPIEIINTNKSLIASVANETWGDICSFPEQSLGKIFSLLRKSHRKKCPLSSLDVTVSGCGAWNGCRHVSVNPDGGLRERMQRTQSSLWHWSLHPTNSPSCPSSGFPAGGDNTLPHFLANLSQVLTIRSWKTAGSGRTLWLGLSKLNQSDSPSWEILGLRNKEGSWQLVVRNWTEKV